jgi:hypothetical protein
MYLTGIKEDSPRVIHKINNFYIHSFSVLLREMKNVLKLVLLE